MDAPIFVTGATGTIGSHLVQRLTARGLPVRAFVRDPVKAQSLQAPTVEIATGDFEEPDSVRNALHGIEKMFLLSPSSPDQVVLQGNVVRAAEAAGVRHIVKVSALGARPDAPFQVGRWHAETEDLIRDAGLSFTFLHPHSFMQNFLGFAATIQRDGVFYAPIGDAAVSMVDARDVAEVGVAVLEQPALHAGRTYIVTGPTAVRYAEAAEALSTVLDRPIRYVDVAPETYRDTLIESGMAEWLADDLTALSRIFRAGHGAQVSPVVRDLTGRRGRSFGQFARDYADLFRRPLRKVPA